MKDYSKMWECFVQGLDFNHKLIKKDILNSWRRCKKYNVPLYELDTNLLMNPVDKGRYILKSLPEYNEPPFQEFCTIVENLKLNISIYDRSARLKYIVNYDYNLDHLYPQVGYFLDVSEDKIGTNSTCMAILENKPFMVVGPDHYKYIFHQFSCAAAPFYDQENNLAGTINASFAHTSVNNDTLNIIFSMARLYETLVLKRMAPPREDNQREKMKNHRTGFFTFNHILGQSEAINQAKKVARRAASVDSAVLIYGESGTGKEVFAQAIHTESRRKENHFVAINCGAIPKDLVEGELFGYEAGAFTGAVKKKQGLLEYASGGTLFLDEVDSMPLSVQVKLIRALSASAIMRIGGFKQIPIDVRVLAASKKDLTDEIKQGNFREDLYYRLNVIQVNIPPLRKRKADIKPIFDHYKKLFISKNDIKISHVDDKFMQYLEAYHWPGNVRELLNIIERSLVLSENGVIDDAVLSTEIKESYMLNKLKKDFNQVFDEPLPKGKTLLQIAEAVIIERVLKEENHNLSRSAERLGMSRPTLYKRIKESEHLKLPNGRNKSDGK